MKSYNVFYIFFLILGTFLCVYNRVDWRVFALIVAATTEVKINL